MLFHALASGLFLALPISAQQIYDVVRYHVTVLSLAVLFTILAVVDDMAEG